MLGPEMKSTGEVMGIDSTFALAFAKAELAASTDLPLAGQVFISVRDADKPRLEPIARGLRAMGFALVATGGTARHIQRLGHRLRGTVNKVAEGSPHVRRSDARGRDRDGDQHARRGRHRGLLFDSAHGAGAAAAVLHHDGGRAGRGRGYRRAAGG